MTIEPQPGTHAETPSDVSPQLVKRVHELYEELGRQDVQAVRDWEKAQGEIRNKRSDK
jgi:H+-transporting ATPase